MYLNVMAAMIFFSFILLCLYFFKKFQLIESFVLNLKFRAAQKGGPFCVFRLHRLCLEWEAPSPAHLGSHRNLVFSPSSLQISHSLKEG